MPKADDYVPASKPQCLSDVRCALALFPPIGYRLANLVGVSESRLMTVFSIALQKPSASSNGAARIAVAASAAHVGSFKLPTTTMTLVGVCAREDGLVVFAVILFPVPRDDRRVLHRDRPPILRKLPTHNRVRGSKWPKGNQSLTPPCSPVPATKQLCQRNVILGQLKQFCCNVKR